MKAKIFTQLLWTGCAMIAVSFPANAADNVYCSNVDSPDNGYYIAVQDGYGPEALKITGSKFTCSYVGKTDATPTTVAAMVSETGIPFEEVEAKIRDYGILKPQSEISHEWSGGGHPGGGIEEGGLGL